MQRFNIGYRHADGALKGYVGYGFAAYSAHDNAVRQIREACAATGEPCLLTGPTMRVVMGRAECRHGEFKSLQRQWRQIRNAIKARGASIY